MATFDSLLPADQPAGIEIRLFLRVGTEEGSITPYLKDGSADLSVRWADGTDYGKGVGFATILAFMTDAEKQAVNTVLNGMMDRLVAKWMSE